MNVTRPIVINQINIGLANPGPIAEALRLTLGSVNIGQQKDASSRLTGDDTIDYCRLNSIQVQAWSPLRGVLRPPADANPQLKATARLLGELADKRNTSPAVIALAWLLRHPAGIVPIIGSDNPKYIIEDCAADRVTLSREEWYELFAAAV